MFSFVLPLTSTHKHEGALRILNGFFVFSKFKLSINVSYYTAFAENFHLFKVKSISVGVVFLTFLGSKIYYPPLTLKISVQFIGLLTGTALYPASKRRTPTLTRQAHF